MTQGSQQRERVERRGPLSHRLGPETTPVLKMVLGPFPARAQLVPAPTPHSPVWAGGLPFTTLPPQDRSRPWALGCGCTRAEEM